VVDGAGRAQRTYVLYVGAVLGKGAMVTQSLPTRCNQTPARYPRLARNEAAQCSALGEAELEIAADEIIRSNITASRKRGVYTSLQLARKIRDEARREWEFDEFAVPGEVIEYLAARMLDDLIEAARLNSLQEIIFRLRLDGLSVRFIAATLSINPKRTAYHLGKAERRIRAAYAEGRYAGWYEVYLSEVNRSVYRPPRSRVD